MTPFQTFYLVLSLVVFALAWTRGGHTERAGVAILVCAYVVSLVAQFIHLNGFRIAEATALAVLVMAAHAVTFLTPELTAQQIRADVAARWGIGVLVILSLAAGVVERWMAGEAPASRLADWKPRRTRAT